MKTAVIDQSGKRFSNQFVDAQWFQQIDHIHDLAQFDCIAINGEQGKLELAYEDIKRLWSFVEYGGILYGEMVICLDFSSSRLFGFKQDFPVTKRRLEKIKFISNRTQKSGNLLEWNGPFVTGFSVFSTVLMEIGIFKETHLTNGNGNYPGLTVHSLGRGNVIYSAFPLFSNNEEWSLRPYWLWKEVLYELREVYGLPCIMFERTIHFKKQTLEEAVNNSVNWFLTSGILPDPSGKLGIYENIHSITGAVSRDIRPDCNVHSALMFYLYGKYRADDHFKTVSRNILQYLFENGFQDEDEQSPTYGLWKWFQFPGEKPVQMFTDDNAWVALVLLYLYRQTGIEEYKKRGLITAKTMLETQNKNGLRPEVLLRSEVLEKGRSYYRHSEQASMNPHFESIAHAAFIQAYLVSENEEYLETAKKGTLYLLAHLEEHRYMYSKTSAYSRFLFPLAQLSKLTNDPSIRSGLKETLNYLHSNQHPKGGVEEADNPAPDRYGSEDTGVFIEDGEEIADQLYTNNFLVMNIWEAWKATDDKEIFMFHSELASFLANIQIQSDRAEFAGGWMRSYYLGKEEYFGNNGDTGWGPYCIESGWTNGLLTSGLLLKLLNTSLLD